MFYTTDSTQRDRDWVVEDIRGDRLSVTIVDLSPETTYYFKVQARNSVGSGPSSPTVIYRTPKCKYRQPVMPAITVNVKTFLGVNFMRGLVISRCLLSVASPTPL